MEKAKKEKLKWLDAINEYKKTENYKQYMKARRVFNKSRKTKIEKLTSKSAGKRSSSAKRERKARKKKLKSRSRSRSITKKKSKSRSRSRSKTRMNSSGK